VASSIRLQRRRALVGRIAQNHPESRHRRGKFEVRARLRKRCAVIGERKLQPLARSVPPSSKRIGQSSLRSTSSVRQHHKPGENVLRAIRVTQQARSMGNKLRLVAGDVGFDPGSIVSM
jgi:hypothetical protein